MQYLVGYLYEIGPSGYTGDGITPITWIEMDAWSKRTQTDIEPWDFIQLRNLSMAFVKEAMAAKNSERAAPWQVEEIDRSKLSIGIEKAFDGFQKHREANKGKM